MTIEVTRTRVRLAHANRIDNRRAKLYGLNFSLVVEWELDADEEYDRYDWEKMCKRVAGLASRFMGASISELTATAWGRKLDDEMRVGLTPRVSNLVSYSRESQSFSHPLYGDRDETGQRVIKGGYLNISMGFRVDRPKHIPAPKDFEALWLSEGKNQSDWVRNVCVLLEGLGKAAIAEYELEKRVERAVHEAKALTEAVRNEADKRAKKVMRFDQRLKALLAEYEAEFVVQIKEIYADDATWQEAVRAEYSPDAIEYVQRPEYRDELCQKPRAGVMRGPIPHDYHGRRGIVDAEVEEYVREAAADESA